MSQPISQLRLQKQKTKHQAINQQQHQQQLQQQHHYHPEQSNASDPLLDRRIQDTASGLVPHYSNVLSKVALSNKENALTIISYINVMRTEVNLSDSYRRDLISLLSTFSNYFQNR